VSRQPTDPLRPLTAEERAALEQLRRAQSAPAVLVARATLILAVADGATYTAAARAIGRRSNDAVAHLVRRFNRLGLAALERQHGGGPPIQYGPAERARILRTVQQPPDRERDGTATWSLTTLQRALRTAPDGLPTVSTFTILAVLHEAGLSWQRDRSWCATGQVQRVRKSGVVTVVDPDTQAKKKLIEDAYLHAQALGLDLWCEDEAGPFQTAPVPGPSWQPEGQPATVAHEYVRQGTAKLLTLFHPADGQVRVKGVERCTNAVLHPWLQAELAAIVAGLPPAPALPQAECRALWERWQAGLQVRITLPTDPPPLRMLLILDNLAGHKTPTFVTWCFAHGIMPLYTPVGGSWLNMAESIQRIVKRRALEGSHPTTTDQIIAWLEAVGTAWNRNPTPFEWGGKRAARRARQRQRRHSQGGSGAVTRRPIRRSRAAAQWRWT